MFITKYKKAKNYHLRGMYLLRNGNLGSGLYFMERSRILKDEARKEEKRMLKAIFG